MHIEELDEVQSIPVEDYKALEEANNEFDALARWGLPLRQTALLETQPPPTQCPPGPPLGLQPGFIASSMMHEAVMVFFCCYSLFIYVIRLFYSFIRLFIYFIHLFYSFIRLFIYFIHLFVYSFIRLFIYSFIRLFYSFIYYPLFIIRYLFVYLFICLFI
jgi:hypothetical protein